MNRVLLIAAGLAVMLGLAACGSTTTPNESAVGDVAEGRTLFQTGGVSQVPCATCHTLDGSTLVGPSLQGISERAKTRVAGLSDVEYIHQSIVDPSAYVVEGYRDLMNKTYGETLSEGDINNLIAFLLTQ